MCLKFNDTLLTSKSSIYDKEQEGNSFAVVADIYGSKKLRDQCRKKIASLKDSVFAARLVDITLVITYSLSTYNEH